MELGAVAVEMTAEGAAADTCTSALCKCPDCTCGSSCTCGAAPDAPAKAVTCDPCDAFKAAASASASAAAAELSDDV